MKILYLSGAPAVSTCEKAESGGPRSHILGIISGFRSRGWEVEEFIFGNRFLENKIQMSPDKVLSSSVCLRLFADIYRIWVGFKNSRLIARKYKEVDLAYERFSSFQALGHGIKKKTGALWVLEANGIFFLEAKKQRHSIVLSALCRKLEKRAYEECDRIVTVSEELKRQLIRYFDLNSEKIIVIPNAVDAQVFSSLRHKDKKKSDKFVVGFVGRLNSWCGLDVLFEAAALWIKENAARPLEIIVVGDGVDKEALQEKCKVLNLSKNVRFLGHRPWSEIPQLIESFDVGFVGPDAGVLGTMYHSPVKLYEYMAMGRPVITSRFRDSDGLIEEGVNGFFFELGNKEELKNKLESVFQVFLKDGFRGEEIRNRILDRHTWTKRVDSLLRELGFETVEEKKP